MDETPAGFFGKPKRTAVACSSAKPSAAPALKVAKAIDPEYETEDDEVMSTCRRCGRPVTEDEWPLCSECRREVDGPEDPPPDPIDEAKARVARLLVLLDEANEHHDRIRFIHEEAERMAERGGVA